MRLEPAGLAVAAALPCGACTRELPGLGPSEPFWWHASAFLSFSRADMVTRRGGLLYITIASGVRLLSEVNDINLSQFR